MLHPYRRIFDGEKLHKALLLMLEHNPCVCGARQDSLDTHPHVGGCPVGEALG